MANPGRRASLSSTSTALYPRRKEGVSELWISYQTAGVLAEVALSAPGRFAAFDDLVTLTMRAADRDERHGPFLPKRDYEDEAQCDSNLSPSPLLKHYPEYV